MKLNVKSQPSRLLLTVVLYGGMASLSYVAIAATIDQHVTVTESNTNANTNSTNNSNDQKNTNTNANTGNGNTNTNTNENTNNTNTNVGTNTNVNNNASVPVENTNQTNTNSTTNTNSNDNSNHSKNINDDNTNTGNANTNSGVHGDATTNQNFNSNVNGATGNANAVTGDQPAGKIPGIGDWLRTVGETTTTFIQDHPTLQRTNDFVQSTTGNIVTTSAGITGVASWSALATSQAVGAGITVTSLADIYALVIRFFGALFGISKRKRHPWGTVYDAVTKRPLDPAYVLAKTTAGKAVKESFTDLDGRYGFLLPPGSYLITAQKTHYAFPSKTLVGRTRDELYDNLYFGETITTSGAEVVSRNIPLDPVGFDWNEFEKNQQHHFRFYSKRRQGLSILSLVIYSSGFVATAAALFFQAKWWNVISALVYVVILLYQLLWLPKRRPVTVQYDSGRPLSFAIIRFFSVKLNKEVKSVVSDEHGRFYVLLEPSQYYITVEAKQLAGGYSVVYRSDAMTLAKGVVQKSVIIPVPPPVMPPTPLIPVPPAMNQPGP